MSQSIDYLAMTYRDLGGRWSAELTLDDGEDLPAVSAATKQEAARGALMQYIRRLDTLPTDEGQS